VRGVGQIARARVAQQASEERERSPLAHRDDRSASMAETSVLLTDFPGDVLRSYWRTKSANQRAVVCVRSYGAPMSRTPALTNQRVRPVAERSSGFPRQSASLRSCSLENDNLPAVSVFLLVRSDWRNAASRHVLLISRCNATLLWIHSCVSELCLHPIASTHAG